MACVLRALKDIWGSGSLKPPLYDTWLGGLVVDNCLEVRVHGGAYECGRECGSHVKIYSFLDTSSVGYSSKKISGS